MGKSSRSAEAQRRKRKQRRGKYASCPRTRSCAPLNALSHLNQTRNTSWLMLRVPVCRRSGLCAFSSHVELALFLAKKEATPVQRK
jgi:hypothetical protein